MAEDEIDNSKIFLWFIISIGIFSLVILVLYVIMNSIPSSAVPSTSTSTTQTVLANNNSPVSVTPNPSSVRVKNTTWLECDGVDDFLAISNSKNETISFWYRNATTDWTHVVNSSGTLYVDGSLDTPLLYPLEINATHITFCKEGATFYDMDIDEIRLLNSTLDAGNVTEIYNEGR